MTIVADIFQTGTHKTEWFMLGPVLNLKNFLDGFLVENITTNPVHCICGITNNSSTTELLGNLPYMALLRIIRIN